MRRALGLMAVALALSSGVGCSALLDFGKLRGQGDGGEDLGVGDFGEGDLAAGGGDGLAPPDGAPGDGGVPACPSFPDGGPAFEEQRFPLGGGIGGLDVGDLNGDGRPDVVAEIRTTRVELVVMLSATARGFTAKPPIAAGCAAGSYEQAVFVGRFDGDTHQDVVASCGTPTALYLLSGDGAGALASPVAFANPVDVYVGRAADLDEDGITDLVALERDTGDLVIYWGGTNMTAETPLRFALGASPADVDVGVIAGTGRPAIVATYQSGTLPDGGADPFHTMVLRPAAGARAFEAPQRIDTSVNWETGVRVGRFTGDAFRDVALISSYSEVSLLRGKADGTLEPLASAGKVPRNAFYLAAGDLDCDGIDDLALTHYQSSKANVGDPMRDWDLVTARRGSAAGSFTEIPLPSNLAGPESRNISIADFDGDRRPDIAVGVQPIGASFLRILWSRAP